MSWPYHALQSLADSIDYGVSESATEKPVGPKFLRITDIQNDSVDWNAVPFCSGEERKLRSARLSPGDIVFARTGATTGKSFLVRDCPDDAVFASYLIRVRAGVSLHAPFLAHFFRSSEYWNQISSKAVGAAQPGINASKLGELKVPLPPLDEQKRIAAILDQADELRRKRHRALGRLSQLGQAIFHEMFGTATAFPGSSLKKLGKVSTGSTPRTSEKDSFDGPIPFVTPGDLGSGDPVKRTLTEKGASQSRTVGPNATLVCCIGATIGKMDQSNERSAFNQQINAIEWSDAVDPTYGYFAVQQIRSVIIHKGRGASTTLPILKKSEFEKLEIPNPPMAMQLEFSSRITALAITRSNAVAASDYDDRLFASLQHRAFRGEL